MNPRLLRRSLKLDAEHFHFVLMAEKKYMLKQNTNIADVYQQHKDEDGFLYLLYSEENIYG